MRTAPKPIRSRFVRRGHQIQRKQDAPTDRMSIANGSKAQGTEAKGMLERSSTKAINGQQERPARCKA